MTTNRGYLRRPEIQIARKILQTDEARKRDIKTLEQWLADYKQTKQVDKEAVAALNLVSLNDLSDCDIDWIIEHHIKALQKYCDIVSDAYVVALDGVPTEDAEEVLTALIYRLESVRPPARAECNYPLSEHDMAIRERAVLRHVLRAIGLMPVRLQPSKDV